MSKTSKTKTNPPKKGKLILIEDDPSVIKTLRRLLVREDYEVADFDNPKLAIEKLSENIDTYDLMIIDINLPGMDGFDVSMKLKESPELADVPIIFISAIHTSSSEMSRGLSLGAVDYLIKPFDPDIFLRKVDNFVLLRKNEERLKALKMRYQLLFEKYNDPTVILDLSGHILEVNNTARDILNIDVPDVLDGATSFSFLDMVHKDDKRTAKNLMDSLANSGSPQNPKVVRIKDRLGNYLFMEINGGVFFEKEGAKSTPDSIHITLRDITERVILTKNLGLLFDTSRKLSGTLMLDEIFTILAESIEKAIAASRIDVIYLNLEGNATLMATAGSIPKKNKNKITLPYPINIANYPEYQVSKDTKEPVIIEDVKDNKIVSDVRENLLKIGIESILVIPIVMGEKTYGFINVVEFGKTRRFTVDEIEVLKSTADLAALSVENALLFEETKKNDELKTHLINVFTHEVGTPLGTIIGHTQILMEGLAKDKKRLKNLNVIFSETERLNSLMEGFLDITRLRSGKLIPKIERINPGVIATKLYNDFEKKFRDNQITPSLEIKQKNLHLDGDLLLIEVAVANLLSNSLKYTPANGEVTFTLKQYKSPPKDLKMIDSIRYSKTPLISFSVKDTGIGVPKGDEKKIFEEFYRSENVPADEKGAGLGLTFAKEVAELHGGTVRFVGNSEDEDGGSTFEIILPTKK